MEKMYKTLTGWRIADITDYNDNARATHYLVKMEEYDQTRQEERSAWMKLRDKNDKLEKELREAKNRYEYLKKQSEKDLQEAEEKAEERIREAMLEVERAENEAEDYKNLNKNLLRISKERANSERGLKPKKQHTGYVVLTSTEKSSYYMEKARNGHIRHDVTIYETVLQTPYSANLMEYRAAKNIIKSDTYGKTEGLPSIYALMGFKRAIDKMDLAEAFKEEEKKMIFSINLRQNFNFGYWELIIQHKSPLGKLPPEILKIKGED